MSGPLASRVALAVKNGDSKIKDVFLAELDPLNRWCRIHGKDVLDIHPGALDGHHFRMPEFHENFQILNPTESYTDKSFLR